MNPVFVGIPDDGLAGGTDNEFLLQLGCGIHHHAIVCLVRLQAVVGHHGALLGEPLDVLSLLAQEGLGNEQGEIGILHPRSLEHVIKDALHLLPDGITIGLDDHTAAHVALLCEVCLYHQLVVPLGVVNTSFCQKIKFFCHSKSF